MDEFCERFKDQGAFSISSEYFTFFFFRKVILVFNLFLSHLNRYFEHLAISILDLFDKNESDFFNDNLLLNRNNHFSAHILHFANNAKREKFMATNCAQKVLNEIWNNGILFSFNKKIIFSDRLHSLKV